MTYYIKSPTSATGHMLWKTSAQTLLGAKREATNTFVIDDQSILVVVDWDGDYRTELVEVAIRNGRGRWQTPRMSEI
jgi:outer membrane protein assembly factor BamB